jgi:uncharacterized surface protein with fasciclin (FAS1) repeats
MCRNFVGRRWLFLTTLVVLAGWTAVSVAQERRPEPPAKEKNVVDVVKHTHNLKTFYRLIESSGLAETLKGQGPYTVFAPTDEAFDKLGKEKLADLEKPENKAKLEKILKYHVLDSSQDAAALEKMKSAKTLAGEEITITLKGEDLMINGAKVIKTNAKASNGLIHEIDTVLMPKD